MPTWISEQHRDDRLAGTLAQLNRGPNPARLKIFGGAQPAGGGAETALLAVVPLLDPPGTVSAGVLALATPPDALVLLGGTATWARIENGEGAAALDCEVTDLAGAGPIKLERVELLAGSSLRLVSAAFT